MGYVSLVRIDPAINGKTLFKSDEKGAFAISDVAPGTYTVAPLFFPEKGKQITVAAGSASTFELKFDLPSLIQFLYFNVQDPAFAGKTVRQAIGFGLDREAVAAGVNAAIPGNGFHALNSFLYVPSIQTTPLTGLNTFSYSASTAQTRLGSTTLAFTLYYYGTGTDAPHFGTYVTAGLNGIPGVTATPNADDKNRSTYMKAGTYQVARGGWQNSGWNDLATSLMQFFKTEQTTESNLAHYSNAAFDTLCDEAMAAIDKGDADLYLQKVIAMNNILVDEVPAVPVYYKP